MQKHHLRQALFLVMIALSTGEALAADVNITGKVIAAACSVSTSLSSGQQVDLGTLGRTKFQFANDAGEWQSFSLLLNNCPEGTKRSTVTFTGTADENDATLFANTEPETSAAKNIAIEMAKDADHSVVLSNNSTMTVDVDTTGKSATFPLAARMYTSVGGVQTGTVTSTVLVNFTYQ